MMMERSSTVVPANTGDSVERFPHGYQLKLARGRLEVVD